MNHAPILLLSLLALAPVANALGTAATVSEGETTVTASPTGAAIRADSAATLTRADPRPEDNPIRVSAPVKMNTEAGRRDQSVGDLATVTILPTGRADTRSNEWVAVHARASHTFAAPLAPPVRLDVTIDAARPASPRADPTALHERLPGITRGGVATHEATHDGPEGHAGLAPSATHATPDDSSRRRAVHAEQPVGIAALTTQAALARTTSHAAAASLALLAFLAPWILYHRARGHRVLDQSTRNRIFAALEAEPGLSPADAARQLELDPTTVRYHLRRLVKEGLVVEEGRRRAIRYFPRGSVAPADRAAHVAAHQARPVLEAVRQNPGASKSDLARRLGLGRPTVTWHLDRLARVGLVTFRREGRTVLVDLARQA